MLLVILVDQLFWGLSINKWETFLFVVLNEHITHIICMLFLGRLLAVLFLVSQANHKNKLCKTGMSK